MKPNIATSFPTVICLIMSAGTCGGVGTYHVRSLKRPEEYDHIIEIMPAIRYGGHVKTKVIV